ncbi:MAG: hypothetical protein U1D55_06255 [Phycisphaerae bacterium]
MNWKLASSVAVAAACFASTAAAQLLLVPDWTADRVMAYSAADGSLVNLDYIVEGGLVVFNSPKEVIQVGSELWVTDQVSDSLTRFNLAGNMHLGTITGGMDNIRGAAFANGRVYVANNGTGNGAPGRAIVTLDPTGAPLGSWPLVANGDPFEVFELNGELLIVDIQNDNVDRFSYAGAYIATLIDGGVTGLGFPQQITLRTNGNLLIAAFSVPNPGVYEYTPAGASVNYWGVSTGPRGAYELGDGEILYTDSAGVHKFDPTSGASTLIQGGVNAQYITAICPGDLNGDRRTDEVDLGVLLAAWLTSAAGDYTGDGATDEADLGILLANWQCAAR